MTSFISFFNIKNNMPKIEKIVLRIKPTMLTGESLAELLLKDREIAGEVINPDIVNDTFAGYIIESIKNPFYGTYECKRPVSINDCKGNAKEFMEGMEVNQGELVISYLLHKP